MESVRTVSAKDTIQALRMIFCRNGLPDLLVSDNATSFSAFEFTKFLEDNCVKHVTSPPYMPASNGQAERGVKVIKDLLNKQTNSDSFQCRLAKSLLYYRATPLNAYKVSPSFLLNNMNLVIAIDKIHPIFSYDVKQPEQKEIQQFKVDHVLALNLHRGPKWYNAVVSEKLAINVYYEDLDITWKRHKNQLLFVSHS